MRFVVKKSVYLFAILLIMTNAFNLAFARNYKNLKSSSSKVSNSGVYVYRIKSSSNVNTNTNQVLSNTKPEISSTSPNVAENGDVKNIDNDRDGRIEPVHVKGYYRKNGTYVRGHYRAKAGKK
jgi:hypothetical protein